LSLYVVDANVVAKWFVPERLSPAVTALAAQSSTG